MDGSAAADTGEAGGPWDCGEAGVCPGVVLVSSAGFATAPAENEAVGRCGTAAPSSRVPFRPDREMLHDWL